MSLPIEGWMVRTRIWGVEEIWGVRGYTHPTGSLVATPQMRGSRRLKPYDLSAAPLWLMSFLPCIGRAAPLLREREVIVIDPARALKERKDLWREIVELIDILAPDWVGLTGSWAVFEEKSGSDVDLLVFHRIDRLVSALRDLREEGTLRECGDRYGKVSDSFSVEEYEALRRGRLMESCYRGRPYTIRALRMLDREPCEGFSVPLGRYVGSLRILSSDDSYAVPARYSASLGGREIVVESWHTRYQELRAGEYVGSLALFERKGEIIAMPDIDGYLRPVRLEAESR